MGANMNPLIDRDLWRDLPGEVWLDITGYKFKYQVSSCGRIRRCHEPTAKGWYRYRELKGNINADGYRRVLLSKKSGGSHIALVHRLVLSAFCPVVGHKFFVDHINGDPSDNRLKNLRWATPAQNNMSCRRHKSHNGEGRATLKGVTYMAHSKKKPWISRICVNGDKKYLGCFVTEQEAHNAYLAAAVKYFGIYASSEK